MPRPKRSCRSIGAIELLRGADLPSDNPSPRKHTKRSPVVKEKNPEQDNNKPDSLEEAPQQTSEQGIETPETDQAQLETSTEDFPSENSRTENKHTQGNLPATVKEANEQLSENVSEGLAELSELSEQNAIASPDMPSESMVSNTAMPEPMLLCTSDGQPVQMSEQGIVTTQASGAGNMLDLTTTLLVTQPSVTPSDDPNANLNAQTLCVTSAAGGMNQVILPTGVNSSNSPGIILINESSFAVPTSVESACKTQQADADDCSFVSSEILVDEEMQQLFANLKPHQLIDDHMILVKRGNKQVVACRYCKVSFLSKFDFMKHYRNSHDSEFSPWKCPICDFKSMKKTSIAYHMNQHAKKKPYVCNLCGRGFGYKQKFKLHMKYHEDVRDQECPYCLKSFHEKKTLTMHISRRHTNLQGHFPSSSVASVSEAVSASASIAVSESTDASASHPSAAGLAGSSDSSIPTPMGTPVMVHFGSYNPASSSATPMAEVPATGTSPGEPTQIHFSTNPQNTELGSGEPKEILIYSSAKSLLPESVHALSSPGAQSVDPEGGDATPQEDQSLIPVETQTHEVTITTPGPNGSTLKKKVFVITNPAKKVLDTPIAKKGVISPVIVGTTKTTQRTNAYRRQLGLSPLPNTPEEKIISSSQCEIDPELLPYCTVAPSTTKRPNIYCKFCSYLYHSGTSFAYHLFRTHGNLKLKPYECKLCNYSAKIKGNLEQHMKFHANTRPFVCSICNKGFIQKYKLELHMKSHVNLREWKCDKCESAFNDKQDLNRHMKNVHFSIDEAVFCKVCNKPFKNDKMLEQHMHIHTGLKEFQCSYCNKLYSTRESLRSHEKGHKFEFGCEICSKPLGSYSAFIAHKRLHDPNQKGFPCDICGKVLPFQATLNTHKLTMHSDKRPFSCDMCSKTFKTKGQLTNHKITHTKEKPYTCNTCGYSVKRKDSLKLHMLRHATVKPFRCGRCGKEYTQKQALEIHLRAKHAGVSSFSCGHCSKGFNTNYLLKRHLAKAHGIEEPTSTVATNPVVIAQQEEERKETDTNPAEKQTVLINAQVCEHCQQIFISQHALAVHILNDHMNQKWGVGHDGIKPIPEEGGDGIADTMEIPIGEEMVIIQPDALSQGGALEDKLDNDAEIAIAGVAVGAGQASDKPDEEVEIAAKDIEVPTSMLGSMPDGDGSAASCLQGLAKKIVQNDNGSVILEIPEPQ